jgi:hypothetical protein
MHDRPIEKQDGGRGANQGNQEEAGLRHVSS